MLLNYIYKSSGRKVMSLSCQGRRLMKNPVMVPNVLIRTDDLFTFNAVETRLSEILDPDFYLVYQLMSSDTDYVPQKSDTALVVAPSISPEEMQALNGCCVDAVVFQSCSPPLNGGVAPAVQNERWYYALPSAMNLTSTVVVTKLPIQDLTLDQWRTILHDQFPRLKLQNGSSINGGSSPSSYPEFFTVLAEETVLARFRRLGTARRKKFVLDFRVKETGFLDQCPHRIPVRCLSPQDASASVHSLPEDPDSKTKALKFDFVKYWDSLQTKYLGRVLVHCENIGSTFDVFEGSTDFSHGAVAVADHQTAGRGRGGNRWLSPVGCAMFSMQLKLSMHSRMGQSISLLQHLVGLACVQAVKSMKDKAYESLDLKLKWPNDIYTGSGRKLGGVVITSYQMGDQMVVNLGMGVDLNNDAPTLCLNSMARDKGLPAISREEFLAAIFNCLESFLCTIEIPGGLETLRSLYHQHWLHGNQMVSVKMQGGTTHEKAKVVCLDDGGYLLVRLNDGTMHSVHPDGNSFDMMQGLIMPKN